MVSLSLHDIWIQIMMINASMDRGDHPLHYEHIFACIIIWILLGVMDIVIGWCATEREHV